MKFKNPIFCLQNQEILDFRVLILAKEHNNMTSNFILLALGTIDEHSTKNAASRWSTMLLSKRLI